MKTKNPRYHLSVSVLVCLASQPGAGAQAQQGGQVLDEARATLAKWMETRQIISKEKEAWDLGKEVLQQRIDLMGSEIATLEEKITETRSGIGEADKKKYELESRDRTLKTAAGSLSDVIVDLENRTRALLKVLPEPLQQRVAPLAQRIPDDPGKAQLTLGERFQNVIGILNEANKFNQDITVTSELRVLPDGSRAEVKTIYVGVGQAYYVTLGGDAAGIGRPGLEGWEWTPMNELAPQVASAIAILQNEQVPAYVPLPVVIR